MSDIRKWFMKQHDKGNGNASSKPSVKPETAAVLKHEKASPARKPSEKPGHGAQEGPGTQEGSSRRKTSKYFSATTSEDQSTKQKPREESLAGRTPAKRKAQEASEELHDVKPPSARKPQKFVDDEELVLPKEKKSAPSVHPPKKLKSESKVGNNRMSTDIEEDNEEKLENEEAGSPPKPGGRGRGGRGRGGATVGGRGRGGGGGRGGFMNFGERKDPPHKGEKEVPEGAPDCLAGLTFVISGTLDSLEREEAEDLIKRHGGRVTGSVSKKTVKFKKLHLMLYWSLNFLLADEDIGGRKSEKARELGTSFLTEDGLFDMIRASKPVKPALHEEAKKISTKKIGSVQPRSSPVKVEVNDDKVGLSSLTRKIAPKGPPAGATPAKQKGPISPVDSLTWTEKYKPKVPNEIIGNQSLIDGGAKKAVLLSGSPGIGKTTSAKLVSQMLGFEAIEVNASDSRGKADSKIFKGIGGSTANSVKELISNEALNVGKDRSKHPKSVLIMDEVDGMSAGDRGGVADLIASIKISKIPIICICNDRYSQKLKSLVNYCQLLSFRKPTKQQIALEELAERVNGDMRLAINELRYMSLSLSVIKYDDIRGRLLNSSKDEDISPFTAVDKLFGYNGGKLRMDERIDLSMSDPDLVPLLIQENYLNYRPTSSGKDDNGVKRLNLIARAAESIGDGDLFNVQIRRYRQWQLSQSGCLASCIIPAALLHGQREVLEQGERNYNRFGGWLGKNSTMGKNQRLLEDVHIHILASRESCLDRQSLRVDYFSPLLKQLTDPLRVLPKDAAVQQVVEIMDAYSLSQEDFDTIMELSKFQGHPSPLDGIPPTVKAALTRAYKQGSSLRVVRAADLIALPGLKKAPKKRIAAMLEPVDNGVPEQNGDALVETEDEGSSDVDDQGILVQLDLKNSGSSNTKKKTPASKAKATGAATGRGSGGAKRKR
ncbi:hypothetical protein QJS04_geneDACA012932 [Acorus gramineus]|uniref:Replication factor C subunit 1 n=1 Tax=Acorus gramineus TaxID=55184 RepID=A0AAV9B396_ACOGR|nr:hypothetical protein QJS04_geneDACA012932 [Acorus gramineus]